MIANQAGVTRALGPIKFEQTGLGALYPQAPINLAFEIIVFPRDFEKALQKLKAAGFAVSKIKKLGASTVCVYKGRVKSRKAAKEEVVAGTWKGRDEFEILYLFKYLLHNPKLDYVQLKKSLGREYPRLAYVFNFVNAHYARIFEPQAKTIAPNFIRGFILDELVLR